MDIDAIRRRRHEVIERFGPWTASPIHLGNGLYTSENAWPDSKVRQIVQIVSDITDRPLSTLRVLDLACLEGKFGIEMALHGAKVLAIEGREVNLAKARFAKEVLGLDNLELMLDDVRNLDKERHGTFDVVLCLGILYHLDVPDVFNFIERIAAVCRRVAVIDTHVSLKDIESVDWNGKAYWGKFNQDHPTDSSPEEKLKALWDSLDNVRTFQFTRPSLCNALRHAGFTSVYACQSPSWSWLKYTEGLGKGKFIETFEDRVTFVAIKGKGQSLLSSPVDEAAPEFDLPEKPSFFEPPKDHRPGKSGESSPEATRLQKGLRLLRQGKILTLLKKTVKQATG
jgi:SAM-dependent methyltransferase